MGVSSKCWDRGRRREGKAGVTGCVSSPKTLHPDAGRGGGEQGGLRFLHLPCASLCKMMLPYVLLYLNSRCGELTTRKSAEAGPVRKQAFQGRRTSSQALGFIATI